jgi:molybdopterin converting factor small subunit
MQVVMKLFALLREKAGTDTVILDAPAGARLSQAVQLLLQQHPELMPYMDRVRFARHMEFVDGESLLTEDDEIALIAPVSGGR